jgi:hypothetical protein
VGTTASDNAHGDLLLLSASKPAERARPRSFEWALRFVELHRPPLSEKRSKRRATSEVGTNLCPKIVERKSPKTR